MKRYIYGVGLCGLVAAYMMPHLALAVPAVPQAEPGRVQQQLQLEEQPPAVGGESVITLPEEGGKAFKGGVTFKLKGITFEHLTVFTPDQLRSEYVQYIGRDITLGTLKNIAANITARYRNAGYILSRAVIPEQRITNGVATIRIVEGYVNKVVFEGKPVTSGLLYDYAQKIQNARPLNAATLERYLLLMQDLPGVTARAVLRPARNAPGASDVIIVVGDKPVDGSFTLDNRGTRYLGPLQAGATVNANNVFGVYDRTTLHGVVTGETHEMQYGQILHEEQLDSEGTKLDVSISHTRTHPSYTLRDFDINGADTLYSAVVSHPFIRSRQTNLYGNVQFDIRNTDAESLGTPLYSDRLHVLRAGGSYDFLDRFSAVNRVDTQLSKGFGWDDNSAPFIRSRAGGPTNFWKWTADASRLQPITGPFSLYLASTGQMASDELLSAEQFGLGGPNFGSAYDPSELTGDSGIAGRAELQFNRSGDLWLVPQYQLYTFYDIGKEWTRNPSAGLKSAASLASAGFGTRFNILQPLSGSLEVAWPLTKEVAAMGQDGKDPRVFFSLAYRY